jgi:hypothetical protein
MCGGVVKSGSPNPREMISLRVLTMSKNALSPEGARARTRPEMAPFANFYPHIGVTIQISSASRYRS